nr:hypothetical protein [Tanacetum cinerariifolium]
MIYDLTYIKEPVSTQKYVLLHLWSTGSKDPQNLDADAAFADKENESEVHVSPSSSDKPKKHDDKAKREAKGKNLIDVSIGVRDLSDEFEEFSVNSTNKVNASSTTVTAVGPNSTNSTNNFNVVGPSNTAHKLRADLLEVVLSSKEIKFKCFRLLESKLEEKKNSRLKRHKYIALTLKLEQFQVNTKLLNSLPPEWSKFVTDVKLVKDLHITNFDQLHAYLQQHKLHANEVRIMRKRNHDPLALVANHQQTPSHFNTYQSSYNHPQFQQQFSPSLSPQYGSIHPIQHYSSTHPSTPLAISYPKEITLLTAINKMMSFLSTVITSRFPSTNNQLRNSSNIRQQATIHDGRVTIQPVQGRQTSFAAGMCGTRANISRTGGNTSDQQRIMKCFNCQGKGHVARQRLKPKRKRNATWFRDTVLLVEAKGNGKVLNKEELEFSTDPGVVEGPVTQTVITHNAAYQADDLDAYDSDCDDFSTAKAVLMSNLSSYESDVLFKAPHCENSHTDMLNQSVQEMSYSKQTHLVNYPENGITSDSNIIPYSQYLLETQNVAVQDTNSSAQQDAVILSVFEQLSNQVTNCNKVNKDNLIANESLSTKLERYKELEQSKEKELLTITFNGFKNESKEKEAKNIDKEISLEKKVKELDNIVCKMGQSAQTIRLILYDGSVIAKETNVILIADSEETLMFEEENSGCSKHMTGDRSQLTDFVHKFLGTVKFCNDQTDTIYSLLVNTATQILKLLSESIHALFIIWKVWIYSQISGNQPLYFVNWGKTPYELLHDTKPDLSYLYIFGALCYPNYDSEDLGKLQAKVDIGLVSNPILEQPCNPPQRGDWDRLFQTMFDEYFNPLTIDVSPVLVAAAPRAVDLADSSMSTSIDQDVPSTSIPSTKYQEHSLIISQGFKESPKHHIFMMIYFMNLSMKTRHLKDRHLIDPSRSVSTRKQLKIYPMWCYFDAFLTSVEPKNFKQAMTEPSWIDVMQEEIHEFERLQV